LRTYLFLSSLLFYFFFSFIIFCLLFFFLRISSSICISSTTQVTFLTCVISYRVTSYANPLIIIHWFVNLSSLLVVLVEFFVRIIILKIYGKFFSWQIKLVKTIYDHERMSPMNLSGHCRKVWLVLCMINVSENLLKKHVHLDFVKYLLINQYWWGFMCNLKVFDSW
jgi:hypothetical protein